MAASTIKRSSLRARYSGRAANPSPSNFRLRIHTWWPPLFTISITARGLQSANPHITRRRKPDLPSSSSSVTHSSSPSSVPKTSFSESVPKLSSSDSSVTQPSSSSSLTQHSSSSTHPGLCDLRTTFISLRTTRLPIRRSSAYRIFKSKILRSLHSSPKQLCSQVFSAVSRSGESGDGQRCVRIAFSLFLSPRRSPRISRACVSSYGCSKL